MVAALVQYGMCNLFVVGLDYGIVGTAYAELAQNLILCIMLEAHIRVVRAEDLGEAIKSLTWASVFDRVGLKEYYTIATPAIINQSVIWFSWEMCFIISGVFSDT